MPPKVSPSAAYLQAITFIASLGIFSAILFSSTGAGGGAKLASNNIFRRLDIAVEHQRSLTLSITQSIGLSPAILEMTQSGPDTPLLSLPDTWKQREVRGGSVSQVPSENAAFGFRRWRLPPGVVVSFQLPSSVSLTIHNPTKAPLYVKATRINVRTHAVTRDGTLITDKATAIW